MTKRELIDRIVEINRSASPGFLARFDDNQLDEYLAHLKVLETPRLSGNAARYEKYFQDCPTIHAARPLWRTDSSAVEEVPVDDLDDEDYPATFEDDEADELVEQPVGTAERERLYAEPDDDEAYDDDPEEWPEETSVSVGPLLARRLPEDDPDDEVDEPEEPHEPRADAEREPDVAVAAAAAETDPAGPSFAHSEENPESWLY